ncbi:MAG: hypothetical protein JO359_14235, partial [Candidatus Eremiobacteraeota bacterium]|nr:hypothetical protein [Candidatus Eremiobacteraeota bacterium]
MQKTLAKALGSGGEYADVFVEHRVTQAMRLQDGRLHEAGLNVVVGAGVRVISGERQGYAFTDDLSEAALVDAARVASLIARGTGRTPADLSGESRAVPAQYRTDESAETLGDLQTYADFLERVETTARAYDPRVETVNGAVVGEIQRVEIATSDGRLVRDVRPLVALTAQIVARKDGTRGYAS